MDRGGCGLAPASDHTGTKCSRRIARRAAARSSASSPSVEEMNTRTRWSGVKITPVSAITSQASPQPHGHEDHLPRARPVKLSWPHGHASTAMDTTLLLPAHEISRPQRGAAAVLNRIVDIPLVKLLRAWLGTTPARGHAASWLSALTDPVAGPALAACTPSLAVTGPSTPWATPPNKPSTAP